MVKSLLGIPDTKHLQKAAAVVAETGGHPGEISRLKELGGATLSDR